MNYSVSHHLREPGVKWKDGVMQTRNVPLKPVFSGMQVVNMFNYIFRSFWIETPTKMTLLNTSGIWRLFYFGNKITDCHHLRNVCAVSRPKLHDFLKKILLYENSSIKKWHLHSYINILLLLLAWIASVVPGDRRFWVIFTCCRSLHIPIPLKKVSHSVKTS